MQSPKPVLTPGSIFYSSVVISGASPTSIEVDLWHANRYLPGLCAALPGTKLLRLASPALSIFTSIFELQSGDVAKATALCAVASAQERPPTVKAIEQFVAEPIALRKRDDAGDWSELLFGKSVVFAVFLSVPAARERELDRWYDEEHLDLLFACNDWLACRRFRLTTPHPSGRTHLALHYLADLRALESPERDIAIRTPWRNRLVAEGWFAAEFFVCNRLV